MLLRTLFLYLYLACVLTTATEKDELLSSLKTFQVSFGDFIDQPNDEQVKQNVRMSFDEFVQDFSIYLSNDPRVTEDVTEDRPASRKLSATEDALTGIYLHSPGKVHMESGNVGEDTDGNFRVDFGTTCVEHLHVHSSDFAFGHEDRGDCGYCRALVHYHDNELVLNYGGDFDSARIGSDLSVDGLVNGVDLASLQSLVFSLAAASCNDLLLNDASLAGQDGQYTIWVDGVQQTVYCDMTRDGGGWTIVYAKDVAIGRMPMVHDEVNVANNPLDFQYYNSGNQFKMDMAARSTQSLFVRGDINTWMKLDDVAFDSNLNTPNSHADNGPTTIWSSNGQSASAYWGYSNFNIGGGGDFVIGSGSIDHHGTNYYHLQSGCVGNYLHSYGYADYGSNQALGDWTSVGCNSGGDDGFALIVGLR